MPRTLLQKILDFLAFPFRALTLIEEDRCGFSSLASERFDYVSRYVTGYCLDIGCGKHNRFIVEYIDNNGKGIDLYPYEGLTKNNIVQDLSVFPFNDHTFDTVTFIANINHVPKSMRDVELTEAYRVLKPRGNIIITMGNPLAEILMHKIVVIYDRVFGTRYDMDNIRGMDEEEEYFLLDSEILTRLKRAGFRSVRKKYFWTQWGFNHLFVAWKE